MSSTTVKDGIEILASAKDIAALRRVLIAVVAGRYLTPSVSRETVVEERSTSALSILLSQLNTAPLATVASITKGKTGIKDAPPGTFPLVVTAEARGNTDHFDVEGPGVMIPMVSSTGHGDASLKRIHYQDGQYAVGSILAVVQPKNATLFSARYLHAYLSAFKDELLVSRMVGTANVSLTVAKLGGVPVPLLPIEGQRKIDELMVHCDRLEAGQAEVERAHAQLVVALLKTLTDSTDAADLAANWDRLAAHFGTLFITESSLDALKQAVVQLAVTGKLVTQDCNDESAGELLARIAELRAESLAKGYPNVDEAANQIRKQEKQSCPNGLAELPSGWSWATLMQCAELVIDCHNKTAPYSSNGIPLLRTTNIRHGSLNLRDPKFVDPDIYERWSARCKPRPGDILITREAPMGEACIIPEGMTVCMGQRMMLVRLVEGTFNSRFFLYTLLAPDMMDRVQDKPVGATVEHLRVGGVETMLVPVPPLAEQHRIVMKVDELMAICDSLKAAVADARQRHGPLASTLVNSALKAA